MEIGRLLFYAVVNCVLVCIVAKSVSLNDLIEAESQQDQVAETSTKLDEVEPAAERFPLELKPISRKFSDYKKTGSLIPLGKKISPLKYRKTFQIKSPLKPKRIKHSVKSRQKRKNQSVKREVNEDVKLKQKYIPLLRSLGMLFDNILGSDSGESFEIPQSKRQRFRYYIADDDAPCKCATKSAQSKSGEEATSAEDLSAEVSVTTEATTETAHNPPASDISRIRQHKIIPILLPRNTFGARRNNNGLSERSSSAHNGSSEGDISRDIGNSEYDPERGLDGSGSTSDEEYTDSDSRNRTSRAGFRGIRDGQSRNITEAEENDAVPKVEAEKPLDGARGHTSKEDQLEIGRHKEKSAELLPKPVRRFRGFLPENQIGDTAESIQSKEDNEKGYISVPHNSSSNQRIIDRNGTPASEDQETHAKHEKLVHGLTKSKYIPKRSKVPVVTIVDGYSVTRHKNGENKLSEKAIHIHSM